ncbi:MAG TPA: TIGR02266 family protein, partial [Thermoanaerobaculia bacterium]|nr:TIGR02266 family protein [Thermoanaerobaculia bacterium]
MPDEESPPAPDQEIPTAPTRSTVRVPLAAEARVEFETFSGFLSEMAANLSLGGMFLRTRYLKPVGSELRFELRLADQQPLVAGRGEVAWIRWKDDGPRRRAGMGIRFLDLDTASRELVYRVVDEHLKAGGWPFDVEGGAASPLPPSVTPPSALAPVWTAQPETAGPEFAASEPSAAEPAVASAGTVLSSWSGPVPSAPSRRWLAGAAAAAAAAALLAAGAWWMLRGGDRPD